MSDASGWMSWAMKNVTPERLQSAMGYVKENVDEDDLKKLADSAVVKDIKAAIADEIKAEVPAEPAQSGSLTSKWTSWMRTKADAAPPAPPPTTTRQKYIRLAVKNWKYTMPVAMWLASSFWWVIALVLVVAFIKKRKTKKA